jgi:hypothetical protein
MNHRTLGRSLVAAAVSLLVLSPAVAFAAARRTIYGRASYAVGAGPIAIAAGDLSGDGRTDFVTANPGDDTISVLVARPGGAFRSRVSYPSGTGPVALALGDLDGDASLDVAVVVANCPGSVCGAGMLAVFHGRGDGTLDPPVFSTTDPNPQEVTIADLDADGDADVAVTCALTTITQGPGNVAILLGNGDGSLQPAVHYPAGDGVGGIVAEDFTGDGTLDLAITNGVAIVVTHAVALLAGNGDGSFQAPVPFDTEILPTRLVAGRFDAGPTLDLAVLAAGGRAVSMLVGNGDGTFQPRVDVPVGFGPTALAASDLDGDGDLDLASTAFTALTQGGSIGILRGHGDGTFDPFEEYLTGAIGPSLVAGDFDADGTADLAAPDRGSLVIVFHGTGGATLQRAVASPAGALPFGIAAADFDADGALDAVTADVQGGTVSVLLGDGAGGFAPPLAAPAGVQPLAIVAADFDRDGRPDVAVTNAPKGVAVLLGTGGGGLGPMKLFPTAPAPIALVTGDFTADGTADLATANQSGTVSVLKGRGDGTFEESVNSLAGPSPESLAAGDFVRDGKLDLAVAAGSQGSFGPGVVDVLFGIGDGRFEPAVVYPAGVSADAIAAADLDGDKLLDLVVGTNLDVFGSISVLDGEGGGHFKQGQFSPAGGLTLAVAAADLNADGRPDVLALNLLSNTLTVFTGRAGGQLARQANYDPGPIPAALVTGDFNGDGLLDTAVTDQFTSEVAVLLSDVATPAKPARAARRPNAR